jgi:hypothetical protein
MGGGSATAKTINYVLVAADAGTTVSMNAAGATTITVNTGLFAAGDTVFIQNLGAGACTITAGTATVSTAGSLILPQYDAGILYFTATGASIFYDYVQAGGGSSPLTTKGDLYGFSTLDARIPIGTNNQVLTADSAQALGLKWATPAGGGGKVLQVVSATYATSTSNSTSTFATTNLTVNITPTLNTSTILVLVSQNGLRKTGTSSGVQIRLKRGSTVIVADFSGYAAYDGGDEAGANNVASASLCYVDSPATTSATTYVTEFMNPDNSAAATVQHADSVSTITLLEIGA